MERNMPKIKRIQSKIMYSKVVGMVCVGVVGMGVAGVEFGTDLAPEIGLKYKSTT